MANQILCTLNNSFINNQVKTQTIITEKLNVRCPVMDLGYKYFED